MNFVVYMMTYGEEGQSRKHLLVSLSEESKAKELVKKLNVREEKIQEIVQMYRDLPKGNSDVQEYLLEQARLLGEEKVDVDFYGTILYDYVQVADEYKRPLGLDVDIAKIKEQVKKMIW